MRNSVILTADEAAKLMAGEVVVKRDKMKPQPDWDTARENITSDKSHPIWTRGVPCVHQMFPDDVCLCAMTYKRITGHWSGVFGYTNPNIKSPYHPDTTVYVREPWTMEYNHIDKTLTPAIWENFNDRPASNMPRAISRMSATVQSVNVEQTDGTWYFVTTFKKATP